MQGSYVKKLWDGVQDVVNLRTINLSGSKQLIELPDFSKAQMLEFVYLSSCESLCYVHPSILSLPKLASLDLYNCIKLKNLQSRSHLKSLKYIWVNWCFSLTEFSLSSELMEDLELTTTGIETLDSSIGRLLKLQSLRLNGSKLKNLPIDGLCCLRSLQELDLSNCDQVIDKMKLHIPFDALKSLQVVHLDECCSLTELPNNIKHLSRLRVLSLKKCRRLKSTPELPPSIEELDVSYCTSLEKLLLTSQVKVSLLLEEGIQALTLHSSIGYLGNLRKLRLNVSSLRNFSIEQLCCLRSLKELTLFDCGQVIDKSKLHMLFDALSSFVDLYLEGCSNLKELPDNFGTLSSLYLLGLEGSNVEYLPTSIKHLLRLQHIYLTNCKRLRSLPEFPPFTRLVKATNCISLETAFPLITSRPRRKYLMESLFLENCLKLDELSLFHIEQYANFSLKRAVYINRIGAVCYPGSKAPEWFRCIQTTKASNFITVELSSTVNNLLGFVFCSVLPQFTLKRKCQSYLKYQCYFEDGEEVQVAGTGDDMRIIELNSHHVFLWYDPIFSACILRELIKREDDQGTYGNPKLSFEFSIVTYNENYEITKHAIKACGICPIYASEYDSFLQQMEMEFKIGSEKKTCHETYEHSLRGIMEYVSFSLKRAIYGNFERRNVSYTETTIPEWFTYKVSTTEDSIYVNLDLDFNGLLGFIFCFVIPQFSTKEKDQSHSGCRCRYGSDINSNLEGPRGWHYSMVELNSDNAFLWYDPLYCEFILEEIGRNRGNDEGASNYNPKLSFEFEFGDCLIKECGVRPLYALEYNNFLQQRKPKLELGSKTKRRRDTCDEEEQLTPTKKLKESSIAQPVPSGLENFITGSKTSENIDELLLALSELNLESMKYSTQQ